MVNISQKRNLSSMQVMKTLQIILENNYTMAEILQKLNDNESTPIFNNSVVSKYINTCRYCGMKIYKIQNKYFVSSMPFGLRFDEKDINCLSEIRDVVENKMSKKSISVFNNFLDKINKFADKKIGKVEKGSYTEAFEVFEHAIADKRKIRIMFISGKNIEGIPITITSNKGRLFFNIFTNNKQHLYDVSRVSAVEETSEKFVGYYGAKNVVFTLKDKLAKRYETRENEIILNSHQDGSITVTNKCENPEMLLSRLMRYDDKCEINIPEDIRNQMKTVIDNTLKNYGIE